MNKTWIRSVKVLPILSKYRQGAVGLALLACLAMAASAPVGALEGDVMKLDPRCTVDGKPLLGTYVAESLEDLELVNEVGMNMVIGDREHLDPASPQGAFMLENGIKVLYHLTKHIHGTPRLASAISAEQTEIPLDPKRGGTLPEDGGAVQIEDELIRYERFTPEALVGCTRGADDTSPAAHHEGIILFNPEACAKDVAEVKDSPNLWGYYVLDDSPGDAISALRALYQTVRRVEGDSEHRPICAGFGSDGALANFGPGVCDLMLIYWYPISDSGYNRLLISHKVQWMLATARARVPGIPFAGIFQTFWGEGFGGEPTRQQLREQMEDFVREGACGLITFLCHHPSTYKGWADSEAVQDVLREVHQEVLDTGALEVSPEPEAMAQARVQPKGIWETPGPIPGIIPAWYVIGPLDDPNRGYLAAVHPPEGHWDLEAVHEGRSGPVRWLKRPTQWGVVALGELQGPHAYTAGTAAYAVCTVTSPIEQQALMLLGRDDDLLVWFGDKEVARFEGVNGLNRDEEAVPVTLPAGDTPIRVKCCNRKGMWGFSMRFVDLERNPLDGLSFSPGE